MRKSYIKYYFMVCKTKLNKQSWVTLPKGAEDKDKKARWESSSHWQEINTSGIDKTQTQWKTFWQRQGAIKNPCFILKPHSTLRFSPQQLNTIPPFFPSLSDLKFRSSSIKCRNKWKDLWNWSSSFEMRTNFGFALSPWCRQMSELGPRSPLIVPLSRRIKRTQQGWRESQPNPAVPGPPAQEISPAAQACHPHWVPHTGIKTRQDPIPQWGPSGALSS